MIGGKHSAILLAAGLSSRMGSLKALLPWQGKTLIEYQIEQLIEAGINEVIVVLGYKAVVLWEKVYPYGVTTVINHNYAKGKSTSIQKGAQWLSNDTNSILVSAVDQPVSSKTLGILINSLTDTNDKVVIPIFQEKRGHPILFSSSVKGDLLEVNEETQGLRNVIRKYHDKINYVPVNDSHILLNLNSPNDVKSFQGGLT